MHIRYLLLAILLCPFTITAQTFGHISSTGELTSTGSISFSGGTQGGGHFTLQGQPSANILMILPTAATISNGKTTVQCSFFTSNLLGGRGTLGTTGLLLVKIGCTLTIGTLVTAGVYVGTYNISCNYQ